MRETTGDGLFTEESVSMNYGLLGPYDFHDAENADGIVEPSHKNGIYSLTWNNPECVKVWMN